MANEGGRRLILEIFKNIWESLKPRQIFGNTIGKDYFGNTYYEIPADPRRGKRLPTRWFEPETKDAFDQEMPAEWEAWLRNRRKVPPTDEEVMKNYAIIQMKRKNAAELEVKYAKERGNLPIPELPKSGYESFPKYDDYETSPGQFRDKKT